MGPTSVGAVEEPFPPPVTCTGPCTPGGQMGMAGVRARGSLSAFEGGCPTEFVASGELLHLSVAVSA